MEVDLNTLKQKLIKYSGKLSSCSSINEKNLYCHKLKKYIYMAGGEGGEGDYVELLNEADEILGQMGEGDENDTDNKIADIRNKVDEYNQQMNKLHDDNNELLQSNLNMNRLIHRFALTVRSLTDKLKEQKNKSNSGKINDLHEQIMKDIALSDIKLGNYSNGLDKLEMNINTALSNGTNINDAMREYVMFIFEKKDNQDYLALKEINVEQDYNGANQNFKEVANRLLQEKDLARNDKNRKFIYSRLKYLKKSIKIFVVDNNFGLILDRDTNRVKNLPTTGINVDEINNFIKIILCIITKPESTSTSTDGIDQYPQIENTTPRTVKRENKGDLRDCVGLLYIFRQSSASGEGEAGAGESKDEN